MTGSRGQNTRRSSADTDGLDQQQRRILHAVQSELQIEERPFDAPAKKLGLSTARFIGVLRELKDVFIKRIGPIFDSNALGYSSTLVGGCVPEHRLEEVAGIVSGYDAVTHNYRRTHAFNLWFTLITPTCKRLDQILDEIKERSGLEEFCMMPARRVYKIHACFGLGAGGHSSIKGNMERTQRPASAHGEFGEEEKELVRRVQAGLPFRHRPFLPAAEALGRDEGRVVERLRKWHDQGVIRRFGAVLQHRRAGYRANGMCVFNVPEPDVDQAGTLLARMPQVTHCYLREVPPQWGYNLFAMAHSAERDKIRILAQKMAGRIGARDFEVLFSTREYKKTPMRYFTGKGFRFLKKA